jgi:hypothetical protein
MLLMMTLKMMEEEGKLAFWILHNKGLHNLPQVTKQYAMVQRCPCAHTSYHEDIWETGGYLPCILKLGTRWSFMLQELIAGEKTSPVL